MQSGKTEYKSCTVVADAGAEEMMDFYLDDPVRRTWDPMITLADMLLAARAGGGDDAGRLQLVHWRRTFPFGFLSAREYVIGRRVFREGPHQYAITKAAAEHPAAPAATGEVLRVRDYHSMWRTRAVPCPFGSTAPACEVLLVHQVRAEACVAARCCLLAVMSARLSLPM